MIFLFLLQILGCFQRTDVEDMYDPNEIPEILSVMTLNLAHGRANGRHQFLLPSAKFRKNLEMVASFIQAESPDIIALQEADGPSFWSGRFDHVDFLAQKTDLPHFFRGSHNQTKRLDYGTAILSNRTITHVNDVRFIRYAPLPAKGFVHTKIQLTEGKELHLVSIHLDPLRSSVRKKQLDVLIQNLQEEKEPLIIMGDFNTGWSVTLSELCQKLSVKAYQPESQEAWLNTFPKAQKRLDWILISEELDFAEYTVHSNPISDHYAVSAKVKLNNMR